jgi:hypothetical protein
MDLLLLLMGGNPLPNYITSDYTLIIHRVDQDDIPTPGKIIFVSTDQTENFFQSILKLLKKRHASLFPQSEETKLGSEHRSPDFIRKEIIKVLKKNPEIDSIHLNYTGGTKPMAANAVIAVSEFARENDIKLIMSDLDPDNFKLISYRVNPNGKMGGKKCFPVKGDLRDYVHLNIDEIFELHHMKNVPNKKEDFILNNGIIDIIPFSQEIASDYRKSTRRKRFLEIYKSLAVNNLGDRKKFISAYPYLKGIFDVNFELKITPGQFYAFICGKWLEDYLYLSLKKIEKELNITFTEIRKNVEAKYDERPCEIDVVVVRGFRMFLFSCTTSQKIKLVKQKAFEALFRAEQLGGEHAKVIIVSTMFNTPGITGKIKFSRKSNLEELGRDVKQFNADQKCELIGLDELTDVTVFENRLKQIFQK